MKQMLVAFRGAPGSGKSTLSRAVSRELRWPLVDKDDVKDLLDGHTPAAGGLSYDIMFQIARRQLLLGLSVICDSPFVYHESYRRAVAISAEANAELVVVDCHCSDEALWRHRIEARQARLLPAHHTTTWDAVRAFQTRSANGHPFDMSCAVLQVDTLQPISTNSAAVVAWLRRRAA